MLYSLLRNNKQQRTTLLQVGGAGVVKQLIPQKRVFLKSRCYGKGQDNLHDKFLKPGRAKSLSLFHFILQKIAKQSWVFNPTNTYECK